MITTNLPNMHQTVLASAEVPGVTVQLEENWLQTSGELEIYTCYTDHVLSLIRPDPSIDIRGKDSLTRFTSGRDGEYLRIPNLTYNPAGIQRHIRNTHPTGGRSVICYFDPVVFNRRTGLGNDWSPADLQACHRISGRLMLDTMDLLFREMSSPGFAHGVIVESFAQVLMIEISRYFKSAKEPPSLSTSRLAQRHLDRIRDYLDSASGHAVTIQELANSCGLSSDYLRCAFKESTGQSLGSYVEQTRIAKAKTLLSERDLTLKQVAHQVGFSNPSSFSVAFHRATGETPKGYQRRTTGSG